MTEKDKEYLEKFKKLEAEIKEFKQSHSERRTYIFLLLGFIVFVTLFIFAILICFGYPQYYPTIVGIFAIGGIALLIIS